MELLKILLRKELHSSNALLAVGRRSYHHLAPSHGMVSKKYLTLSPKSSDICLKFSPSAVRFHGAVSYSTSTTDSTSSTKALEESANLSEAEPEPLSNSKSDEVVPSKSQTGEQLPSEVDESNSKLDKLYKLVELEILAYEPSVLDSYQWFVLTAATHLGITVGKVWSPLKPDKMRFYLLKSAFVHKKHVVQYEVRTHHRFISLHKLTSSTADTFLEYIERNLPEGVGLKVTRVEAKALPDYITKGPELMQEGEQAAAKQ